MNVDITLKAFEEFLIGKREFTINSPVNVETIAESKISTYSKIRREKIVERYKEAEALKMVRYIVNNILKRKPQDAADHMTPLIFKKTHLDTISKYIIYPKDIDRVTDYAYLIKKAFPNDVEYDIKTQIRSLYERVKSGELKRFPKKVFYEHEGILKLSILLNDFISENIPSNSIEDLYEIFANQAKANKMLKEANLYYAYKDFYDTPLEYLHESLGIYQDNFLYSYYQLEEVLKQLKKTNNDLLI